MGNNCIILTAREQKIADDIQKAYPQACQRASFSPTMCCEWIGSYITDNNKPLDFRPDASTLVNFIEKKRNQDGKSFLYTPESITYTPVGKRQQTYTVLGTHIYNKDGKEVFATDSKDRRRIFANLAVQQKRAVVVEHKGKKYVVNNRNQIISAQTGDEMRWGEENGDRKAVLALAGDSFKKLSPAATTPNAASEAPNTINQGNNRSSNNEEWSVEQILNEIINGKRQFNNLSAKENDVARGDKILAAAEVAARLHGRANQEESQDDRNERQERQVEEWAKQAGVWHEDALAFGKSFGLEMEGGQESHVYENPANKSVIKVKNTTQYHDLQEFLDGIVLHNTLFPETAYKVIGFGNDGDGFVAILEQPFVIGEAPTQEQIDGFIFDIAPTAEKYEQELKNGRYKTSQTLLHDISPKNAIITPNGNIAIIDAIIRPNVASEGKGGTRSGDYGMDELNPALENFKKEVDMLAGYYEGGGRVLKDDYPTVTDELDRKLDNYFLGNGQLTIEDYRELYRIMHPSDNTINPQESRLSNKEGGEIEQIITVAPYFRNRLTTENKERLEKETEKVKEKAQKLAATMGLHIEAVETVGGTYRENSEITYQYRVKSSDQELVDLFAALMGDLSNEYQDAVITANYTKDKSQITAYELVWKAPEGTTIEKVEALLKSVGIEGSTFHFSNGQLDIIAFGEEETQEIINKLKDTEYEFKEYNGQNSRYLDNEYRRNAYQRWLDSERGKQNRQLNNACQKALAICEAAAQYPDVEDPANHPQEQKKQEQLRLAAAQKAEREWKVPQSSPLPSTAAQTKGQENTSSLAAEATGFTLSQEEQAEAARRQAEANKPKPERPKSQAYESALRQNNSRVAQFKRTFSPQQIKDRGAMISNMFSDILDEALWDEIDSLLDVVEDDTTSEGEKAQAKQRINELKDPLGGRQKICQSIGIPFIMDGIKQMIRNSMETASKEDKVLWQNTLDYFEDLFNTQATLDIEEREGIRIVGVSVSEQTATDDENDSQNDGDDETGHTVSGSDGWNFQVRYEDPFNSLSKKVRSMLYDVKRPNSERDDLGQSKNYPMGQIYASLLSYLSKNMQSPDDFLQIDRSFEGKDNWGNDITEHTYPNGYPTFPVLEQMKTVYPWVEQIIQRLTDDYLNPEWNSNLRYPSTGGTMASQFYTNFRKAYIPYAKIQIGDGKFGVTPLNFEMEERAQYDKLEANYNNRMILSDMSIYNPDGKVNRENAKKLETRVQQAVRECARFSEIPELMEYHQQHPEEEVLTQEDIQEYNQFINNVRTIIQSFGIDATQDTVVTYLQMKANGEALSSMLSDLEWISHTIANLTDDRVDGFNYITDTRDRYGSNLWSHFFDGRGMITDASYMQSFYDSASHKIKYSYSADNYLMKTFRGACMGTLEQRRRYIDEKFGKYEWFKNQRTGEWRNKWLEFWYNYEGEQKEIPYKNIDNITEYGKNGAVIRQYIKWEPDDVCQVQARSYGPESKSDTAYYLAPIFSDSPMSMTVRGPRMNMEQLLFGYDENGQHRQGALVQLVNQELYRIQYVQQRQQAIKEGRIGEIANFDTGRGQQFCFLPELNNYIFGDTGESFLERMIRLKSGQATLAEIESAQIQAIREVVNRKLSEYEAENRTHYNQDNRLSEEQYYNMVYANAAIIQMTTIDLAYYKNDTDFQKRYKEVYAGGTQLNTNSKYGRKTENIVLLSDDIITSPSYDKIAAVIDGSEVLSQKDKEDIKATFTDINVADAQAIRSMHSFRSVLDMMGHWDDRMEEALNNFKKGEWNREDFNVIYQTIKPFVYAVIDRNDGFGGMIPVPQQNKNSEICALMMYDLIANGLDNSPVYKALSRFMEDNIDADGVPLIDMIQFESAGKVGNQGVINISFNPEKVVAVIEHGVTLGGEEFEFNPAYKDGKYLDNTVENAEENYKAIKENMDKDLREGKTTQEEYNTIMQYLRPTEDEIISMLEQMVLVTNPDGSKGINTEVVHTIPFDNYYQQQPTPEHHIDAEATFGSQARNITVADLPDNFELTLDGKGKNKKTFKSRDAIIDFYYELLNENLIEDFFGKGKKKGLKGIFESKEALRDAVTEIVRGNPKYGRDFAEALQIDPETGNFVLSPNSPTMFNLMQELVTSFFKNRITKQTINGASLIQAAGIGLDKDLRMVFDKDGKLAGAECYMPLTSRRFFEPLLETKEIDGKKVQVLDPKKLKKTGLDKAIGYRIPTENKSSMMPLIIKDFTPLQNGSAIILPAEITDIAGSDFDVDKMFIMLLSFTVQNYDMRAAREAYAKEDLIYKEIFMRFTNSQIADDMLDEEPEDFKEWFEENKEKFLLDEPIIRKIEYDFNKTPKENGRKARNNMLVQMIYGILTSKEGSEQLFNPQGFKDVKRAAKITRILTDSNLREQLIRNTSGQSNPGVLPSADVIASEFLSIIQEKYPERYDEYKQAVMKMSAEEIQQAYIQAVTAGNKGDAVQLLLDSSTKDLERFINQYSAPESPVYPQTFSHSHARNMAGANQIGIYAVQASMTAKYQRARIRMREEQRFTVNGREFANVDVSDGGQRLKNVGQALGASADNGKDPNLSDMGSTTKTAPMIGYMMRTGLSPLEAALIINQPHMWMSRYSSRNYKYWKSILGKNPLMTPTGNVTTEMLIRSLMSPFELTAGEDRAIAALCYRILSQHEAIEYMTQISRADSPNGAMQNSYAKTRLQQYKVDLFQAKMGQRDFPFIRINEALSNDAVDTTAPEDVIREQLKGQRMAFLHGMYALGINSFNGLVAPYFFGARKGFDDRIVKPILYNLNERLSDADKESIVNSIYLSYITFMLSGSPLFGNEEGSSMKSKRDYYVESFPDDYIKVIQENEDIRNLLSTVLQVKRFGSRKRLILQDVGSLSKGQKQDVQRRFESLAYSDNPAARQLAKDLLIYSYFDNGLQFTHDSFSHLFTTEFLLNFPVYNETLQGLDEELGEAEEQNFIHQFLLTFHNAAYKVDNIIKHEDVNGDTIRIDLNNQQIRKRMVNEVMSPNPLSEGINVYPYISYDGEIYVLDKDMFEQWPGTPIYHKLAQYATSPKTPLFSRQMSVTELAEVFPKSMESPELPDIGTVDAPMAHNESDEDSAVDNSMQAAFDSMDDSFDFFDPSDAAAAVEAPSKSEQYQNEGEGELQDPFCQ